MASLSSTATSGIAARKLVCGRAHPAPEARHHRPRGRLARGGRGRRRRGRALPARPHAAARARRPEAEPVGPRRPARGRRPRPGRRLGVRYGPRRAQRVEVTLPEGGGPHPVAVLVHGGFWRSRYTLSLMRPLAEDVVRRGWAAYNVEYRRLGPLSRGGVPQTLDDVAAAIDAIATQPELDATRVVAIGHSAGGHLALWAAGRTDARVPLTGVVGQAAVADLAEAERLRLGAGVVTRFAGERLPEADPLRRAPTG